MTPYEVQQVLLFCEGLLSFIALLFIVLNRITVKGRSLYEEMILQICIGDLILSTTLIIGNVLGYFEISNQWIINSLGTLGQLAALFSQAWAICVSFTVYHQMTDVNFDISKHFNNFKIFCYFSSLIVTTIHQLIYYLAFSSIYGSATLAWTFIYLSFVIFILVVAPMFYFYGMCGVYLAQKGFIISPLIKQLAYFPAIVIICFLPINMYVLLVNVMDDQKYNFLLTYICFSLQQLYGFFDAIVYGWNIINQSLKKSTLSINQHLNASDFEISALN